jgi:polysaccharide biosynthesis protein VpsQ
MWRAAILFALLIAALIAGADTRHLGPLAWVYDFPYGDKMGHFTLYGVLTLLCSLAVMQLQPSRNPGRVALYTAVIIAAVVGIEEFSQLWIPSRSPDFFDLLAGYTGIATFAYLAVRLRAERHVSSLRTSR